MTLVQDIKTQVVQAMKAGDPARRDILKVVLGEVQTVESRQKDVLTDDQVCKIIRKVITGNDEVIAILNKTLTETAVFDSLASVAQKINKLNAENEILNSLLPRMWGEAEILAVLETVDLKAAGNDGQATGLAMKALKAAGASVDGKAVGELVKTLRAKT